MDHQRGDDEELKHAEDIPDLTKLNDITLPTVLDCLIDRFHSRKYSTFAGSVLVALNPCSSKRSRRHSPLKSYENQDVKRFVDLTHCSRELDVKNLEPNVLSIGVKSLYNIGKVGNNQVIVVSGDSGAGKTTCTQDLIKFFTYSDTEPNNDMWTLEKKIYEATLILEALGNASTTANPNSSRFGRLVRLQYSQESKILGAEIKTYMLEKHRVAKGNLNERNFHIFHYLFHAVEHGYIDGRNKSVYNNPFWSGNVQDGDLQQFKNLSTRLTMLDSLDHFIQVFELLFAIMHLLAVEFKVDSLTDEDKENFSAHRSKHFKVSSKTRDHLDSASAILGISTTELHNSFVYNTFSAGNRKSVSLSPCASKEDCESRLHSFISTLYERLFHHVVAHINALLNQHNTKSSVPDSTPINSTNEPNSCSTTVSILDLYGFENLELNHFEQLCINYANERIQQVQISVLKGYFEEERRVSNFTLTDEPVELNRVENETNLRLEELHQRVFCILDEACLLKRQTPDKEIFQQLAIKSEKDQFIKTGQLHDDKCPFIIQHYASDVNYSMAGMIMKNKDFIPDEFISLLSRSSKPFICDLFPHKSLEAEVAVNTPRRGKPEGRKTILMRFKFSVNELVGELMEKENRDIHFIKCIRPNVDLLTDLVQPELVRKQLFACGIVDIIRIAGNGYPIRISTDKLEKDFQFLFRKLLCDNYYRQCIKLDGWQDRLVQIFSFKSSPLKFGKSYAFMTESILNRMRKFDSLIKWKSAKRIQSTWRTYSSELRKRQAQREVAATRIQSCWRAYCLELKKKQNEGDKTPVPTSSSSCNSSMYFTPMTSSISSTFYSVGTRNDTFSLNQSNLYLSTGIDMSISSTSVGEDVYQEPDSSWLNYSTDMNITNNNDTDGTITPCETRFDNAMMMESSGSPLLCMELPNEISTNITPNPTLLDATHELTFLRCEPRGQQIDVFVGDGVISRSAVHTLPIKIYTKKTALGYIKPPKRLTSNGIEDAFEDYKIVMKRSLFPPPRQSTFLGESSDFS